MNERIMYELNESNQKGKGDKKIESNNEMSANLSEQQMNAGTTVNGECLVASTNTERKMKQLYDYVPSSTNEGERIADANTPAMIRVAYPSINKEGKTLVDTGSVYNLIREEELHRLTRMKHANVNNSIQIHKIRPTQLAGLGHVTVTKYCYLITQVGPLHIPVMYYILKDLPVPAILGTPVIVRWGLVINLRNAYVTLTEQPKVRIPILNLAPSPNVLIAQHNTTIPPKHQLY